MYPAASEIKTGTLFFCRTEGLVSKTVQWTLNARWSHMAVAVKIDGEIYMAEALPGSRLGLMPYADWIAAETRTVEVLDVVLIRKVILRYMGRPYDKVSCWNLLLKKIFGKWYGRKTAAGDKKLYCIEYIALLLGIPEWYCATFDTIFKQLESLGYDTAHLK